MWNTLLTQGLDEKSSDEILKTFPLIKDCLTLPPNLNPEIKITLSPQALKRDEHICHKQNIIGYVICGLTQILTKMLEKDTESDTTEYIGNCIRLLCHVHYKESQTRRAVILPGVNKKLKETLEKTLITNYLFGNDITNILKENKNLENSAKDLKPLNNWGPSSNRKQGGRDNTRQYNTRQDNTKRPKNKPSTVKYTMTQRHQHQRQQLRSLTRHPSRTTQPQRHHRE
ncbi:unnamed protein product [Parnassius apollo]|uniref:(apollo) hypothetical protein n=1 Tax=Parnassius apollo TaxID=110799 RepID=A0A8S3WBH3_PARAO|nr:unnamed protein product [Parnassius apollo]